MYLFTKAFWAYSSDRFIKTFIQVLVAGITVSTFIPSSVDSWVSALATAGVASLVSLLTAMNAYPAVPGSIPISTAAAKTAEAPVPLFTIPPAA